MVRASQAAAYQLGRGLADTYWALYPERPQQQMGSWSNVLGAERCGALVRQALRLSLETGPLVLAATTGPLEQWRRLAGDDARRGGEGVIMALYQQGLLWRDLIRGDIHTACCRIRVPSIRSRTGQRDLLACHGPSANGPRRLGSGRIRHEGQQRCKRRQPRGAPSKRHF